MSGPCDIHIPTDPIEQVGFFAYAQELWKEWAEEQGATPDLNAYAREGIQGIYNGDTFIVYAVDPTCKPQQVVGMVQVRAQYDPADSSNKAYGDRLYVRPDWRREGVFKQLLHAAMEFSTNTLKIDKLVVYAQLDGVLIPQYEQVGFKQDTVVLRKG